MLKKKSCEVGCILLRYGVLGGILNVSYIGYWLVARKTRRCFLSTLVTHFISWYSLVKLTFSETSTESQSFMSSSTHSDDEPITLTPLALLPNYDSSKQELSLLDLYSGCGGMSTGLCLGAKLSGVNLITVIVKRSFNYGSWFNLIITFNSISPCFLRNGLLIITAPHARVWS